jgi:hypothetical protein
MSSPPVNIPHKESAGSRRSALTSAFEELALFADQKTDEVRRGRERTRREREPRDASAPRDETRMRPTHQSHDKRVAQIPALWRISFLLFFASITNQSNQSIQSIFAGRGVQRARLRGPHFDSLRGGRRRGCARASRPELPEPLVARAG